MFVYPIKIFYKLDKFSKNLMDAMEESGMDISMFSNYKQAKLNLAKKKQR